RQASSSVMRFISLALDVEGNPKIADWLRGNSAADLRFSEVLARAANGLCLLDFLLFAFCLLQAARR
ncbi:MAG: hypothetical protein ACFN3F_07260, partial [Selenomonas sp.]